MDGTPVDSTQTLRHSMMLHLGDKERYSRNSLNWEDFFGSSLELAPSLLNIYDGIASSTSTATTAGNANEHSRLSPSLFPNHHHDTAASLSSTPSPIGAGRSAAPPSSLSLPRGVPSSSSTPTPSSSCSPTSPMGLSTNRVPYRSAKLPSLREPVDRPVSLMDSETSSKLLHCGSINYSGDSKKRPLSISSASSASSSSPLPVTRLKRQIGNSMDYGQNESSNSVCGKSGCRCNNKMSMSPDGDPKRVMCSRVVSESHSSMDSGCGVENDHSGFRCFDDMSLASSSEAGSIRDDMSSGIQDFVDTSQSSLGGDNTDSFQSAQSFHVMRNELGSNTSKLMDVSATSVADSKDQPDKSKEESEIMRRMGSYIVRNSSNVGRVSGNFNIDRNSAAEENRRLNSISRNEARKNFFSNYEERYTKMYLSSMKNSEPDYAEIDDATPDNSPVTPTKENPLLAASKDPSGGTCEVTSPSSPDVMIASTASSTATTPPPMSPSSSFSSHASSKRSSYSRSSRRAGKSGESPSSPTSPVYVTYVQRVVAEIVDSERTYISSLEDIIYGYLEPLEGMLNMEAAKDDIVCLFSNIREIYDFGKDFLADLELTSNDPIKVAECFVRHNKGFVIYTEYCTNYPCAVEVLTRFMQHSELSELCKERQLALGHGLPLGAYLLKPVQRILKYHLLLQNIVKNYEKENKDIPVLKQAFQHMTEMAHHINEMKRKHEHAVRIQEIQSQLEDYSGEDLTRLGELVLESTFRVYGAKASRQVFLFERGLLISKKKEGGMLSCKTFIKCSNLMLVEVIPNEPLSFHAIPFNNPRAQYTLQARNMEQKRRWCQEMKRLILESFKGRIPDSVKNLVMELGREHDDDYVTKESLDAVRKNQHTAPEYLEKRRVRRKSGSRMPDFSLLKPNKAKRSGQRKDEKTTSRGLLDPGGRRAESKSPEATRRIFSKLIIPQGRSKSHSLPSTPLTESTSITRLIDVGNNTPPKGNLLSPQPVSDHPTTPSPESPVSDLDLKSPVAYRATADTNVTRNSMSSDGDNDPPIIVKHTLNRQAAMKRNSKSKSKSPEYKRNSTDDGKENVKPNASVYSDEEHDDYVSIREDASTTPSHSPPKEIDRDEHKVSNDNVPTCNEKTETRSSSLPSLLDDSMEEVTNEPSKNQCQSSYDINQENAARGRMSRRDLQDAFGGRNNKKQPVPHQEDQIKTFNADENNLVSNKSLRVPNTSQYLNIPSNKREQQKQGEKARLTAWNSMDKLRDGSMTDLSHIHDDPWIINAETPATSNENIVSSYSSLDIHSPNSCNTHSQSHPSNLDSSDDMHKSDSLDWLVYLKRNCLAPNNVSFAHKPKRMSTSVLERSASAREPNRPRRRISDNSNKYSTPPRCYMTKENMKRAGHQHNTDYDNLNTSNSNPEHAQNPYATFPRKGVKGIAVKSERPFSLEYENVPDENQLRDESNRIVAEMEDYISNASSTENIKITNKFPTTLPSINVERSSDDAISGDDKRLSTVSSMSTSSYDSTSSDGMVGTLKSKLNTWALEMARKTDESEHSYNSPLSSDNEDDIHDDEKTLTSTPKPKNSFEPPLNKKKSLQEDRKLESVLREHSLGSESLGSRMAHAGAALTESCKSMPQLQTVSNPSADEKGFQNTNHKSDCTGPPDNSRFSLPATKEATEALSLDNCDIRQSDSGFSFQSNDSTLSDVLEHLEPNQQYETKFSVVLNKSNVSEPEEKQKTPKISRNNSTESVDSTDSFYERRLSIILNSEEIKESLKIVDVYDDTEQIITPPRTPIPKRKSIKERVQIIEENTRPSSPKVTDVRKREPGAIIRQRLESLSKNINYGRSKTCDPIPTRPVSDHRDLTRSKSQPPSQYKYSMPGSPVTKPICSDDIRINCISTPVHGKADSYKSRERVNSLSNKSIKASNLSRCKDSFLLSKSKESLHSSKDNINNYTKRSKETLNSYGLTLPRAPPPAPRSTAYHSSTPGHERNWIGRFVDDKEECSSLNTSNQFVHHAKQDLPQSDDVITVSSASGVTSQEGESSVDPESHSDQQSSEVDNLVIMKGWVRALISKFQDR